jgi:DNA-binding transcriptional MerR regulator
MSKTPEELPAEPLSIQDLRTWSGVEPRTIRHYIARGLLPKPEGRGPTAYYTQQHLIQLLFVRCIRESAPGLGLDEIARLVATLPPDQIRRVALGEEEVRAVGISSPQQSLMVAEPPGPYRVVAGAPPPRHARTVRETWSTISLEEDIEIRIRGSAPNDLRRLARLARQLGEWLQDEENKQ